MISYGRQLISDDDIEAVIEALRSDFLTVGPRVEKFEALLCKTTGAKFAVATSNCTTALHIACLAAEVSAGDRGLTAPITFVASANAIEMCGGEAGFIDIDGSYCLDPELLEKYCRENQAPKVVIPVSFAGIPANLPEIFKLSKQYGFSIIEDAAHSLGSSYTADGKTHQSASCEHSHFACLSFHPVKTITTGEGGAVLTNDASLVERLRNLRSHGIERDKKRMQRYDGGWYHEMHNLGFNYRITDIQCALGIAQLNKLAQFKERRAEIVSRYNQAFAECEEIKVPPVPHGTNPLYHIYPVQFVKGSATRLAIYDYLRTKGIYAQVHYIPVYQQPYYRDKYNFDPKYYPKAEAYYQRCLSLPLHCSLSDGDVNLVIEEVLHAVKKF